MQASETAQTMAEHEHDWQDAGDCVHLFGDSPYRAYVCGVCGIGGHKRLAWICPRSREAAAARSARVERQAAACPVWAKLSDRAKAALRG